MNEGESTRVRSSAGPDDAITPIATLRTAMKQFVAEREWERFHSPKNLAMSLAIEAAELMEHVQWLETNESGEIRNDAKRKAAMGEEMADVFCYLLALCNALDLDLTMTTLAKLEKNKAKYPAGEYRGRYGADDPNPPVR
jgi:NTP pyrophosphatase (non-canonical NTP hydrolase)